MTIAVSVIFMIFLMPLVSIFDVSAEAHRLAVVAENGQAAKAEEAGYIANREADMKRAELERATQTANELVAAEIQKRKQEIAAEAVAAVLVKEQEGKAQALVIANKGGVTLCLVGNHPLPW